MENLVTFDCEVSPNFFLICFKGLVSGKSISIHTSTFLQADQITKIKQIFDNKVCFGFNCRNYDLPIIMRAISNANTLEIYHTSKMIIDQSLHGWQTLSHFDLKIPINWKWFDLQEVAGHRVSLKMYGARLHSNLITELPYNPDSALTEEQKQKITTYCENDLQLNIELYQHLKPQLDLREHMSKVHGQDLMSKSDAQIAEAIMKSKLKYNGKAPSNIATSIKYQVPNFIKFQTALLWILLDKINDIEFHLDAKGSIILPKELQDPIKIGNSKYKLGIGGLHSCEKSVNYKASSQIAICDNDVASYYPSIILNCEYYPVHLGKDFLTVYRAIVTERLEAKRKGDKVTSDALKIVINGTFGKLGNKYSILYSPHLLLQVTLTGQLALLMLIEQFELAEIQVLSANTDGVVISYDKTAEMESIVDLIRIRWQTTTNFILETLQYKALYCRDVNNYFAIKYNGMIKGKGIFSDNGLAKNPQASIIYEAAIKYLNEGIPIEYTIENCLDIRKFLLVRKVTGGAKWKDNYIGKVVRWVYVTLGENLYYVINNHLVPNSDQARPIIELKKPLTDILDYKKYILATEKILKLLGT